MSANGTIAEGTPHRHCCAAGGSVFLFDRRAVRFFRKDGHSWRKKADGKTVRETHEKLKVLVDGHSCVNACKWEGMCHRLCYAYYRACATLDAGRQRGHAELLLCARRRLRGRQAPGDSTFVYPPTAHRTPAAACALCHSPCPACQPAFRATHRLNLRMLAHIAAAVLLAAGGGRGHRAGALPVGAPDDGRPPVQGAHLPRCRLALDVR